MSISFAAALCLTCERRRSLGAYMTALVAALFLSATLPQIAPSAAFAQGAEYTTKAPRAILLDLESGAILFQKNADVLAPPASMSKLMTLAVVFRRLKERKLSLDDRFTMSEHAWRTGGAPSRTSSMFVPINTDASVHELIRGAAIQSGNDAAIALAEGISGSEAKFAEEMTAEARRLGLTQSTFANPHGLDDPKQLMTARELAKLAIHLIQDYPEYYKVFGEQRFEYRRHNFINRNRLIFLDSSVDGLKTGATRSAGYGIVASAVRDGQRLIAVLMGHESAKDRDDDALRLINWGFKSISRVKLFEGDDVIGHARVWGGEDFYVPLKANGSISMALPKFPTDQRLTGQILYDGPLKPPIRTGDRVATLRVISSTSASADFPLFAANDVGEAGILRKGFDTLLVMAIRQLPL